MKRFSLTCILFYFTLLVAYDGYAQTSEAMQKLSFLEGQWKGKAWVMTGPGKSMTLIQSENVQMKLNKQVLLIEGTGREKDQVVFQALAVVAYDSVNRKYTMKAYRDNGQATDAYLEVKGENWLEWGFTMARGMIRYTIKLNEMKQWHEIGEFSADGKTWYKNFEMTLDKMP